MNLKNYMKKLSKTALEIMYYGSLISLGLLLIGIFSYYANIRFWGDSYSNYIWSTKIIMSAQSLLVQTFFFALLFECVRLGQKKK